MSDLANGISLTDEQKQILRDAVKESVDSLLRVSSEKELQKDIAERIQEKLNIKKTDFTKLVSEQYEGKVSDQIAKLESVVELKEMLYGSADRLGD
jgi:hypothetical protein